MSTERHDHTNDEPGHGRGGDPAVPAADRGGDPAREHPHDRTGRRSRMTIVAVAAAVLLAGGGGAYWASASGGGGGGASQSALQPLRFDGPGVSTAASGDAVPVGGGDTYQLTGTLPKGPDSAPVYTASGGADEAAVRHLASLLGLSGPVTTMGGSWRVGASADGGGPALLVGKDAPSSWSYTRFGAPPMTARPDGTVETQGSGDPGNASSSGSSSSSNSSGALTDAPAPVTPQQAMKAAEPLLSGLGLSGAATDASQTIGALRTVDADPVLGGLPTHGWSTTLQVGADGLITSGSGRLTPLAKGDTYPVVTATTALKELNAKAHARPMGATGTDVCRQPVPTMTPLAPGTAGSDLRRTEPCLPPQQHSVQVRGAVFGLSSQFVDGRQTLVPSWLFDTAQAGVKTSSVVAQPAVDPKYITYGGGVTAPGGPSGLPVMPVPVNPGGPVRTGPGQPSDPQAPRPVTFSAYQAKGTTLTVTFYGGLCGTYKASADESATQVRVRVTETPAKPGKVCPMIEKALTAQVTLDQPLGTRTVVDATDGQPVRGQ